MAASTSGLTNIHCFYTLRPRAIINEPFVIRWLAGFCGCPCLPILFADSLHDNELTEHNLGFKH